MIHNEECGPFVRGISDVTDLTDAVDTAVTKELAKQATVAPDIPKNTMKLMKSLPSQAFIDFEAKTVFIDPRLKFKVLVNNLDAM